MHGYFYQMKVVFFSSLGPFFAVACLSLRGTVFRSSYAGGLCVVTVRGFGFGCSRLATALARLVRDRLGCRRVLTSACMVVGLTGGR